jgi:replicative DNA helicase
LPQDEIKRAVDAGYKYIFGCNDPQKAALCCKDNRCVIWKALNKSSYVTTEEALIKHYDYINADSTSFMDINSVFRGIPILVRPGQVVTAFAESGIGKTLIIMQLMLRHPGLDCFFLSLEQGRDEIIQRFYTMLKLNPNIQQDRILCRQAISHIYIEEEDIPLHEIELRIKAVETLRGKAFDVVAIDYMQLVEVEGRKEETSKLQYYAKFIKNLAKRTNKRVLQVSQIVKQMAEHGNTELIPADCRGGASIINMSDYMISAWRDHRKRKGLVDNIISISLCKNRHGSFNEIVSYQWSANSLVFGDQIVKESDVSRLVRGSNVHG